MWVLILCLHICSCLHVSQSLLVTVHTVCNSMQSFNLNLSYFVTGALCVVEGKVDRLKVHIYSSGTVMLQAKCYNANMLYSR